MASNEPVVLDTCALLWLAMANKKLSPPTLTVIREASAVYVSAISGFEIAVKVAKGKLTLPLPVRDWFTKAIEHHDLTVLPLSLAVCIASIELPSIHEDPCDRFIIAAAKENDWTVVTADGRFPEYGLRTIR